MSLFITFTIHAECYQVMADGDCVQVHRPVGMGEGGEGGGEGNLKGFARRFRSQCH